jgi:hypothetical protein
MESKVKSQLSNKTYTTQLEKLEDDDRDVTSELYLISVSGHSILVAPGKSIMSDMGIAFCYVYVIQQNRVICKLGVYEKKTDTMPLFFDLSTFPEDSLRVFDEYEKNPSRLKEFEHTESNNIFDYLIDTLFPKVKDKKKKMTETYKVVYELYRKDEQDKDMLPILKVLSATRKIEPTETFLQTLQKQATDKTKFCLTLIALEPFFSVNFNVKYLSNDNKPPTNNFMDDHAYKEWTRLKERWRYDFKADKIIDVSIDTYEMLGERDNTLSVIPEISESKNMESVDEEPVDPGPVDPGPVDPEPVDAEPVDAEPVDAEQVDAEPVDPEPYEVPESLSEEVETVPKKRPPPKRKGQTPKSDVSVKTPEVESIRKGTSLNSVLPVKSKVPSVGISLNDVTESLSEDLPESVTESVPEKKQSVKSKSRKSKPKTESSEDSEGSEKLKLKRIPKLKSKTKTTSTNV